MVISCDTAQVLKETPSEDQEISQIDNKPIVKLTAADFYHGNTLNDIRNKLASEHGAAIVEALNRQSLSQEVSASIPMTELNNLIKSKKTTPGIGSSHIQIKDSDGNTEDFVLSVRRYHKNPAKAAHKGVSRLKSSTTYLALSPDQFYLQDDENGNEQWPVTFPAVSLEDPTNEITVTFNADGFVSSSLSDNPKLKYISSSGQPDLVFAEAMPVLGPNYVKPCPDCGSGGSGTYDPRTDDGSRGYNPRTAIEGGTQTYFVLKSIKLAASGDGDGAAELQMFATMNDDYEGANMPLKYRYRFDNAFRSDPTHNIDPYCNCTPPTNNRKIVAADNKPYRVPDVNSAGNKYNTFTQYVFNTISGGYESFPSPFVPLIDIGQHTGKWRIVMSDDDKDYPSFSRRRQDIYDADIKTYNMATGNYSFVETGFTTQRKTYGSSDDPRWASGVRRITKDNVQARISGGEIVANTMSEGHEFEYVFGLVSYSY